MRHSNRTKISLGLIFFVAAVVSIMGGWARARTAPVLDTAVDTPAISKGIYGNISSAITTRQQALVLLNPSMPLELASKTTEDRLRDLADALPEPQWIFSPKKEQLRDILALIAENAHFAKGAEAGIASDDLSEAEAKLLFVNGDPTQPSDAFRRYLELNERISNAALSIKKEPNPNKRAELDLEQSEASLRLAALPHLDDIRSAARKLAALGGRRTTFGRKRVAKMFETYRGARFFPSIDKWAEASGWVRIEASIDEKFDAPIFATGPSDLTEDWWWPKSLNASFGKKVSKVTFEVKRVLIDRPGLDLAIFDRRNWRFDNGTLISDGQLLVDGNAPKGKMPLLVTGFLLCRNIVVTTPLSAEAKSEAVSASAQDAVRFGTLSLGGSYGGPFMTNRFYPALGSRGITSPEVQVMALLCNQLPLTPNPDPNLKW